MLSVEGSGEHQAFTVLTDPPVTTDLLVTVRLATPVGRSRGTYRLDEMLPLSPLTRYIAASQRRHRGAGILRGA